MIFLAGSRFLFDVVQLAKINVDQLSQKFKSKIFEQKTTSGEKKIKFHHISARK